MGLLDKLWRGKTSAVVVPEVDAMSLVATAVEHQRAGRIAEAIAAYEAAAPIDPSRADVNLNLGNCYIALGRESDAESRWRRAIELDPRAAIAHVNLGTLAGERGQLDAAVASYRRAIAIEPRAPIIHLSLGNVQRRQGRMDDAIASFRRAVDLDPSMADAHFNLGNALDDAGMPDDAVRHYSAAIASRPRFAEAHHNLGNVQRRRGNPRAAIASYREALACKPDFAEALTNLGLSLKDVAEIEEAESLLQRAVADGPCALTFGNMGSFYLSTGRFDDAIESYRRALASDDQAWSAHSGLLMAMNSAPCSNHEERIAQARSFGRAASAAAHRPYVDWKCSESTKLRVGFVSGDLRSHPVGYFAVGLLEHLDPARIEAFAYTTSELADGLTERIARRFSSWRSIVRMSDEEAAACIHDDGVHILLDLTGHTAFNRLPMFALRPAPVQASWLGYFATTGLAQMDFLLADAQVAPASEEWQYVERIVRMPDSYLCFSVPDDAPPVASLPSLEAGHVTFGSFNNIVKMNDDVVALWARVLDAVPDSRLFLKTLNLNDAATRKRTLRRFVEVGIDASRITLEGASPRRDYLASYARVDIALDPFPYPGGTISVEGLHQGVPTLTRRGDRFLAHLGESIAHTAGLGAWIASDDEDYVRKAVTFSSDVSALAALRERLRDQVLRSPLFDAPRYARGFDHAMRQMWDARRQ